MCPSGHGGPSLAFFRMMHGGLGPARGQRSRKGPCASYPTHHFSRLLVFPVRARTCLWQIVISPRFLGIPCPATVLRSAIRPFFSFIATVARLLGPCSVRFIVGESLLKDQLLNVNHFRQRCMKARPDTRISLYYSNGLCFID
jgi:hypothetical protein